MLEKPSMEPVQVSPEPIPVLSEEKSLNASPEPSTVPDVVITEESIEILESTTEAPEPLLEPEPLTPDEVKVPEQEPLGTCEAEGPCPDSTPETDNESPIYDTAMGSAINFGRNYWEALSYVALTAFTTLLFSLGYYYIENRRRDGEFIAKINKLEKELLVYMKECSTMDESLKSTKNKVLLFINQSNQCICQSID